MIILFQIVIAIVILFTLFGVVGESKAGNKELRDILATICIISIMLFFGVVVW